MWGRIETYSNFLKSLSNCAHEKLGFTTSNIPFANDVVSVASLVPKSHLNEAILRF